jgi:hypothetical protein
MQPLLKAKEESECVERVCCPAYRAFAMDFKAAAYTRSHFRST